MKKLYLVQGIKGTNVNETIYANSPKDAVKGCFKNCTAVATYEGDTVEVPFGWVAVVRVDLLGGIRESSTVYEVK